MAEEYTMNNNCFKEEVDVNFDYNNDFVGTTKNDVDNDKVVTTEIHWIESEFMKNSKCSTNTKKYTTTVGSQEGNEEHDDNKNDDDDDESDIECFDLFIDPDPKQVFKFQWKFEKDDTDNNYMNSNDVEEQDETTTVVDTTISNDENDIDNDVDHHQQQVDRKRQQQTSTNTTAFDSSTTATRNTSTSIDIVLYGMKQEMGQTLHSTGLTLWRASEVLCNFIVKQRKKYIQNRTVLELGAGLGLCGILAHKLGASSVILTDGDTDTLANMLTNVQLNCNNTNVDDNSNQHKQQQTSNNQRNDDNNDEVKIAQNVKPIQSEDSKPMQQPQCNNNKNTISCQQLIWGNEKQIESFLYSGTSARNNGYSTSSNGDIPKQQQQQQQQQQQEGQSTKKSQPKFDTIIGSDIIYVEEILHPLFSTVYQLLQGTNDNDNSCKVDTNSITGITTATTTTTTTTGNSTDTNTNTGHFLLSYARRNVSIDLVFATASMYHMKWEEFIDPITSEGVFIFTINS